MAARGYEKTFKLKLSGDGGGSYTYNLGNFNNQLNKQMILTRIRVTYDYPYVIQTNTPVDNGKFPFYWYFAFSSKDPGAEDIYPDQVNTIFYTNVIPDAVIYNGVRFTNMYLFKDYDFEFDPSKEQKIIEGDLIFTAFQMFNDVESINNIFLTVNWDYQNVSMLDLLKNRIR
jgi:hypothetical protein